VSDRWCDRAVPRVGSVLREKPGGRGMFPGIGTVGLHFETPVGQNRFSLTLAAFPTRPRR